MRLKLQSLQVFFFVIILVVHINQNQLCLSLVKAVFRRIAVIRFRIQGGIRIIIKLHFGFDHELREKKVDNTQHLFAASIIFLQKKCLHVIRMLQGFLLLFQEQHRVGQTESIYTLLNITDGKHVASVLNTLQNSLLHSVSILIFVNHDLFIFLLELLRGICHTSRKTPGCGILFQQKL